MKCIVCNYEMIGPRDGYRYSCPKCGFLASTLSPLIGNSDQHNNIDEVLRTSALENLRLKNFERVLDEIYHFTSKGNFSILDVGCAHGWFLKAAAQRGYLVTGIEPDSVVAELARKSGFTVFPGFFPEDLPPETAFDIITFFDVFEHIPSLHSISSACHDKLKKGGFLVIVLPNSKGILYSIASIMRVFGIHGPLDRLWQKGFPSPHISYFNPENLAYFLQHHGFNEIHRTSLPSLEIKGLWQRLRYDRRSSIIGSAFIWLALTVVKPLFSFFPSDISFQIFRRRNDQIGTY